MGRLLEKTVPSCWALDTGFLKCPTEMPTPLARRRRPRAANPRGRQRKEAQRAIWLFPYSEATAFWTPAPPVSQLVPTSAWRTRLILRQELHLWPRQASARQLQSLRVPSRRAGCPGRSRRVWNSGLRPSAE